MVDFQIKKIQIKGIKSYSNEHPGSISFTPGNNVIIGENGSGKSTILQSLIYILTGNVSNITKDEFLSQGASEGSIEGVPTQLSPINTLPSACLLNGYF